jgi:hypothetical protein
MAAVILMAIVALLATPPISMSDPATGAQSFAAIAPNRDSTRSTPDVMPDGDVPLEWVPGELWMDRVSRGRSYPLVSTEGEPLSLRNATDHPFTVRLKAIHPNQTNKAIVSGFGDLLDDAQVTFTPETITLAPGETRSVAGSLQMSRLRRRWTSHLACVISAEVVDEPFRTQLYARVYAPVKHVIR